MPKVTKSLKINPELWKEVKVNCAKRGIDISFYIEGLIQKDLKKK